MKMKNVDSFCFRTQLVFFFFNPKRIKEKLHINIVRHIGNVQIKNRQSSIINQKEKNFCAKIINQSKMTSSS